MFSPFRLPSGANLHRERDGWVRGRDRVWKEMAQGYAAFFRG